ncbi:MAG: plasmid mobilization relaxosome protein MobC [Roseburia sp.]|nr:plasmid mobilization relaxosome protein MobC [Roseburia sp.]
MRKRNHVITIRMSDEEYKFFQGRLSQTGQTQQSYILNAIRGATIVSVEEVKELQNINKGFVDMMRQLRGLATNVNQMAHVANGIGELPVVSALEKFGKSIEKFRKEEEKRWQSIRQLISQQSHMER